MFSVFWELVCLKLSATLKCLIHFWTIMILFWLIKCLWTKWNPRSLLSVVHTSSSCSWSAGGPAGERNRSCLVFTLQTKSVNTESRCCLWETVISDTLRLQDQKPSCSTSQINTVLCQWDFNIFWTLCILSFLLLKPGPVLQESRTGCIHRDGDVFQNSGEKNKRGLLSRSLRVVYICWSCFVRAKHNRSTQPTVTSTKTLKRCGLTSHGSDSPVLTHRSFTRCVLNTDEQTERLLKSQFSFSPLSRVKQLKDDGWEKKLWELISGASARRVRGSDSDDSRPAVRRSDDSVRSSCKHSVEETKLC